MTESNNNCQKKPPKSDQAFKLSRQAGQQHSQVTAKNFYGKNRELLIDQRVARLRANVQQRLQSKALAPFEQFSLQKQAFTWAAAHERAADLRYSTVPVYPKHFYAYGFLSLHCQQAPKQTLVLLLFTGPSLLSTTFLASAPSL